MTAGYAVPGMPGMRAGYKAKDRACAISSSMSMSKSSASSDEACAREGGNFKRVGLLCQSGQCIKYPLSGKVLKYPDTFSRVQASIPVSIKEPVLVSQFLIGKQVPPYPTRLRAAAALSPACLGLPGLYAVYESRATHRNLMRTRWGGVEWGPWDAHRRAHELRPQLPLGRRHVDHHLGSIAVAGQTSWLVRAQETAQTKSTNTNVPHEKHEAAILCEKSAVLCHLENGARKDNITRVDMISSSSPALSWSHHVHVCMHVDGCGYPH